LSHWLVDGRLAGPLGKDHPIPSPGCLRLSSPNGGVLALPANLKISPAAVIDPDAAPIKAPTAALPA
jgi:hypothetical protein